jgi:hypothetical protein
MVGSSHAGKIGAALTRLGHKVVNVYEPNWKVFKNSVAMMADKVGQKLKEEKVDCVVFCVLDNSVYHAVTDTGDILPPVRDMDGGFHIHGELMLSSRSAQLILFKALRQLLDTAKLMGSILLAPLPRYQNAGCCSDPDHMPGRASGDFVPQLLKAAATNLRDLCFTNGLRFLRVLDPEVAFRGTGGS